MSTFFKRHQRTVIWAIVIAFLVGGVGLFSLNESGYFNSSPSGDGSAQPSFAASVEGEKISLEAFETQSSNLLVQYQNLYLQAGQDPSGILSGAAGAMLRLQIQVGAMTDLIRERIYVQEAKARGVRISKEAVDSSFTQQYTTFLDSYQITEETLASYLLQNGSSIEVYKQDMRTRIESALLQDAVERALAGPIVPTEDQLAAYFEKNIAQYDSGEQVKASHVLVADLETAERLRVLINEGADFPEVAKEYSLDTASRDQGGDLGWFGRGEMVPEFEDAAFSLEVGQLSQPVETSYGYHLILVTDKKGAHTPTLSEVRDQVVTDYETAERSARVATWYEATYAAKDIQIELPLVRALILEEQDIDLGLAEFERLEAAGSVSDPYLPYYIGQIYETKASSAISEMKSLQAIEQPTPEQTQRIADLDAQQQDDKKRALDAYLKALEDVDADEDFLNRILVLNPDSITATFLLGKLLADRGDYVTAEDRYNDVLTKDPANVSAFIASGDLALRQQNYPLAKARYEGALGVRSNDVSILLKLLSIDIAMNQLDQADTVIERIRAVDPNGAKLPIAEADVARARLAHTVEERDALAQKTNRTEGDDNLLAALNQQTEDLYRKAVAGYEAGLRSGGGLDISIKLGEVHYLAGKLDDAEREFDAVILRSPYRADAYEGLAKVLLARGETADALKQWKTALARSFDNEQRIRVATSILNLDPNDQTTRLRLARIYAEQYKWSAAIREYGLVLEKDPTLEEAYSGIADGYTARAENDTALEYLERGVGRVEKAAGKVRLYDQIVKIDQAMAGAGNPLSATGLDALIDSAKVQLEQGNRQDALARLNRVKTADAAYRVEEVSVLIVESGGAAPTAVQPTPDGAATTTPNE